MPAFGLKVGGSMADGTVVIDTDLDSSGIESGLSKLGSTASKGLGVVATAAGVVSTALVGAGAAAIKVGMDFESSMSQVAATMGITVDEIANGSEAFELLEKAAKDAGATTQFSATQAAEALNYLALAGYDAEKAAEALPTVLNLAAAGGLDLAYASDLVTDSMSALGLEMTELESFTDKLAKTSQKSNTSVSQLGEAILTVGGTAKVLAGGTTELNTVLGILADNGIKGAESGTALRNIILSLTAPTDTAARKMKELGLEVLDAEGNMRPMNDIFNDLNATLSDMTQGEQTQVLNELFNKTDLKSVNALLANSGERFDELSGYIDDASGAAANMAETMNDNLKGKLTTLGSTLEGLGIQIYERLEEPLKTAADTAIESLGNIAKSLNDGDLGGSIDKLADAFGRMITKIAEAVETWLPRIIEGLTWLLDNSNIIATGIIAIGTALLALNVVTMIQGLVEAFKAWKLANEGVTAAQLLLNAALSANPIGVVIAAVAGLAAGIIYLWNTNEGFREAVITAWNAMLETGEVVWGWLVKFFTEDIPNAFNAVKEWFSELPEWFGELWNKVIDRFTEWGENVSNFFTQTIPQWIDNIGNWFNELPYKIGEALGAALGTLIQWGSDSWDYLTTNVPVWIENVSKWFSELPGKIAQWLSDALKRVTDWGSNIAKKATESAKAFIDNIITWVKTLPSKVGKYLTNTINKASEFATNLGTKAKTAGQNMVNNIVNAVKGLPNQMVSIGKNIVEGVWNGIASMGSWISSKVTSFFSGIVNGAKKVLGIHSPSRVFRDEVGKFMAEGVGVGFEAEADNVRVDMESSLTNLTAKMRATVEYEQSKFNPNGGYDVGIANEINDGNNNAIMSGPQTIEVPVIMDGREIARVTAPYQDEFEKWREGR